MVRKFLTSYWWIAVLAAVLAMAGDRQILPEPGTWNLLELKTLDWRFYFKPPPAGRGPGEVRLVVIDEESYRELNQPLLFYHTYIAAVMDYLVRCRARVIGLDLELPAISLEDRVAGGYDRVYTRALLSARKQGVEVVLGFSGKVNPPLAVYLAAAGRENLAAFSLTFDRDGSIRRQKLQFGEGRARYDAFPYLLARKFAGESLSPPGPVLLIDYSLGAGIPVYSFKKVLEMSTRGDLEDNPFRDKIVIIGPMLAYEDRHATPLYHLASQDRKRTPGILIHALTLETLLSRHFFREPQGILGGFYIGLAALLGIWCCRRRRPLPGAGLCLMLGVLVALVGQAAFNHFYLIRLTPLLFAIFLAYGGTTVLHYYTEERRRRKIQERFGSFVPGSIIDRLVEMDLEQLMAGETREVALMFVDIRDFTPFMEKNRDDPRKVVRFLNRYHAEMTEIIQSHQGTVSQLTGDGIFAFFGAPVPAPEPVWQAVQAALAMRRRVRELQPVWRQYGLTELRIGIGLHTGPAIVGTIGSLKKMDYTAIGDHTNVAARIEGLTKHFQEVILISEAAYQQVKERVAARPLGAAQIKGHSDIVLFALDGLKP